MKRKTVVKSSFTRLKYNPIDNKLDIFYRNDYPVTSEVKALSMLKLLLLFTVANKTVPSVIIIITPHLQNRRHSSGDMPALHGKELQCSQKHCEILCAKDLWKFQCF